MISSENFNNLKYYSKFVFILLVVFLLLKFIINIKIYEALLLACIITVSILIIENIIFINNQASDPLNCNQCKISKVESDEINEINIIANLVPNPLSENIMANLVPNPLSENIMAENIMENQENKEPFISDSVSESISKFITDVSSIIKPNNQESEQNTQNTQNTQILKSLDDEYEYKCIRIHKNNVSSQENNNVSSQENNNISSLQFNMTEGYNNIDPSTKLDDFINEQTKENFKLIIIQERKVLDYNINKVDDLYLCTADS